MTAAPLPQAHLVGSVPLPTTEEVFSRLARELPGKLKYIPDGETGERGTFVVWQNKVFPPEVLFSPFMPMETTPDPNFKLTLDHIKPTGYDAAALASYQTFKALRDQGAIPAGVRFQVCLPTPMNAVNCWVHEAHATVADELYTQRLLEAVATIQEQIPAADLAIQWDMAVEPAHMEHAYGQREGFGILKPYYAPVKEGIVQRSAQLAAAVKPEIPMGFHICYGDFGHVHYIQPTDAGLMVDLINALSDGVSDAHAIEWVHLPVPKDRVDDAFFTPLSRLAVGDTAIHLGLVHANDAEGTKQRIAAASKAMGEKRFGLSTECGLGRTPVDHLDSIFSILRDNTSAP